MSSDMLSRVFGASTNEAEQVPAKCSLGRCPSLWASPSFPDTFNDMMCSGEGNDEDKKELHGRIQT